MFSLADGGHVEGLPRGFFDAVGECLYFHRDEVKQDRAWDAHAIGRPLLAVRRSDAPYVRPKNIEKLRVLRYESPTDLMASLLAKWPA